MVSIDFSTQISINSLAPGGFAPRTPYKCIFPNFLNFYPDFRQKFDKIFKIFLKKSRNFLENILKIVSFIDFFTNFLKTSPASGGLRPSEPPTRRPPYKPSLGGPRFPPEKIPAGDNVNNAFFAIFLRNLFRIFENFRNFLKIFLNFLNIFSNFFKFFNNFYKIYYKIV